MRKAKLCTGAFMATELGTGMEDFKFQVFLRSQGPELSTLHSPNFKMFDDQDLGFFANFLGIFIFFLVIAYHFVMADPKYQPN
ncbi:hypothetical protein L6452_03842 [Arctium lappa]|uniref:Uncharacterized protein n=1 Tax=Arctium lappa TaxID=4217 RepID=A0ACB9FN98_ARCLA|nr:hypothetical protein L6452_03842 [Arctium lappa]